MDRISYKTKQGKKIDYNPVYSSFVRPEIQGLIEKTNKCGIVKICRNREKFEYYVVILTDLGLIVLDVAKVEWSYIAHFQPVYIACLLQGCSRTDHS